MNVTLENLCESDVREVTQIAAVSLPYDPIGANLIHEKIFGEALYEPQLAMKATVEDKMVGFLAGHVCERDGQRSGIIKIMAVAPPYRCKGIGSQLLRAFEDRARECGAETVRTLDAIPNYLMPGIDPRYTPATILFERRGYTKLEENINMLAELENVDLSTDALEAKANAAGLEIRRAVQDDWSSLETMLKEHFPPWLAECAETFRNEPISLFVGVEGKKVVAFAAYDANNKNTGWFGPMGTDPAYRSHKLGEVTLKWCLRAIREQGHRASIIPWVGPIGFYSRTVGAFIDRVFWVYEKKL